MCKKMKLLQTYSFPQAISIDYPNHVFFEFKFFFFILGPDGPPTNITAIVLESGVQISMQPPVRELANGIIRGYMIYYSARPKTESYSSVTEFHVNVTASIIGNLTSQIIIGLKSFTWYRFQVAAYTSVGTGVRGNLSTDVLTPELGSCFFYHPTLLHELSLSFGVGIPLPYPCLS